VGICFLGTPHHGADIAAWGSMLSSIVNVFKPANSNIVKFLGQESPMLMEVQDSFHNLLEIRKVRGSTIQIVCFYETILIGKVCIVPKASATISGELSFQIQANHMVSGTYLQSQIFRNEADRRKEMTKFSSSAEKGYRDIAREISRIAAGQNPNI